MGEAARAQVSVEDYLRLENESSTRHEYVDGWIVNMAGASPEHEDVLMELGSALRVKMRGTCSVFGSNLRVKSEHSERYFYPDISVGCPPLRFTTGQPQALLNLTLVVEILSPSTAMYDLHDKLDYYKGCPSIQEVVYVHLRQRRITVYRRSVPAWQHESLADDTGMLRLESLGIDLTLNEAYGPGFVAEAWDV